MATYLATVATGQFKLTPPDRERDPRRSPRSIRAERRRTGSACCKQTGDILASVRVALRPVSVRGTSARSSTTPSFVGYALETQTRPLYASAPGDVPGRPRARPPVVRQQRQPHDLARDLAQRGLRDLGGVALGRRRPAGRRRRRAFERAERDAGERHRRSGTRRRRRSRARQSCSRDSVYVRGAMALEALRQQIGEPAFLATLREWTAATRLRQRDDRRVHRARRGRVGPGARPALRRLALPAGQALDVLSRWRTRRPS